MRLAALAAALLLLPSLAAAAEDPVAVMPFRNLNAEASLEWLRVGMAETMIADLRKGGRVKIVERAQLDRALTELALQNANGTEESTAARAGKMVGARTVVVGSFQKAGSQLRIAARFVAVETGVVQEAAKVTGSINDVFSLQDEVVAKLLGDKAVAQLKAAAKPKRKATEKTVQAYRLYAMSLTTASDADRVGLLRQSLALDPDFTYAADDLAALEKRMEGYAQEGEKRRTEKNDEQRRALEDAKLSPEEKTQRAIQLLTSDMTGFRYKALLADAQRLFEGPEVPPYGPMNPREYASYSIFFAHLMLKHRELALQAGERHLKLFAGGTYDTAVQSQMQQLINQVRDREEGKAKVEAELNRIDGERAEAMKARNGPNPVRLQGLDFQRCGAFRNASQFEAAVKECTAFAEKYAAEETPSAKQLVFIARFNVVLAHADLGHFDEARTLAKVLLDADPALARNYALPTLMNAWPRD